MVGNPVASGGYVSYNPNANKFSVDRADPITNGTIIQFTFRANKVGNTRISLSRLEASNMGGLIKVSDYSNIVNIKEQIIPTPTQIPIPTASPTPVPTTVPTPRPTPTVRPTANPTPTNNPVPTPIPRPTVVPTSDPTVNNGGSSSTTNRIPPTPRPVGTVLVPSNTNNATPVQATPEQTPVSQEETTPTPTSNVIGAITTPKATNMPQEDDYTKIKSNIQLSKAQGTAKEQTWIYILTRFAAVFLLIIIIFISYLKLIIATLNYLDAARSDVPA